MTDVEPYVRPRGRGYSWPAFEPGNTVARRHGAQSPSTLRELALVARDALLDECPWLHQPEFTAAVEALCWAEAQCELYRKHFAEAEELMEAKGLDRWDRAEARASRLRGELALTPTGFVRFVAAVTTNGSAAAGAIEALDARARAIAESMRAKALEEGE